MSKTANSILTAAIILCMVILLIYGYSSMQKLDESKEVKVVSTIGKHINYRTETPIYEENDEEDAVPEDTDFEEFIEEEEEDDLNEEEVIEPAQFVPTINTDAAFLIIAGSFKNRVNAETKVKQFKNMGIAAEIVHLNNSKLNAICIAQSATEKEANDTMSALKAKHKIKAYVYKVP